MGCCRSVLSLLLLFLFDHHCCFSKQRCNSTDGCQLRGDQGPDHAKSHGDFQYGLSILIVNDDPTDIAFVDHFLDLADQLLAVDTEFFRTSFFLRTCMPSKL